MAEKYPFTVSFPAGSRLLGAEIGERSVVVELFANSPEEAQQKAKAYADRVNTVLVSDGEVTIAAGGKS